MPFLSLKVAKGGVGLTRLPPRPGPSAKLLQPETSSRAGGTGLSEGRVGLPSVARLYGQKEERVEEREIKRGET